MNNVADMRFTLIYLIIFFAHCFAVEGPYHPRVVWTTNPQTEASVSWSSSTLGNRHFIYYDSQSRKGALESYAFKVEQESSGAYSGVDKDKDIYYHHVHLTGLKPWTTYYFVIRGNNESTREYHFRTAPEEINQTFKIIAGGDSRSNRDNRQLINALIANKVTEDEEIVAFCHGGDYVDNGNSVHEWTLWLNDHMTTYTENGRVLPIIPTRGNHEAEGEMYNQIFNSPGGKNNYFTTELSESVYLVTLNTNIATAGEQLDFLKQSLLAHKGKRWQLANYHAAAYSSIKAPGFARLNWVPLFEQYNLDMVLESDGHAIKRTLPIRKNKYAEDGVIYVGEGGLGVEQRIPDKSLWYLKAPGKCGSGHHIQLLSFSKDTLNYKVLLLNDKEFDDFNLKPRER